MIETNFIPLKNSGLGTNVNSNKDDPTPADNAWCNYRLKGSQVEFVNSMGRKTTLENSITEADLSMDQAVLRVTRAQVFTLKKIIPQTF